MELLANETVARATLSFALGHSPSSIVPVFMLPWRFTISRLGVIIVLSALAVLVSCGGPDQQALNSYFRAVKNGDKVAMAGVSAVEFPETVESWTVIEMGPESVAPFPLKELDRKLREAKLNLQYIAEKVL